MRSIAAVIVLFVAAAAAAQEPPAPCDCCPADDLHPKASAPAKPRVPGTSHATIAIEFDRSPLPGVTVTLRAGGFERAAVSDVNGIADFLNIPPGTYTIVAELIGMKRATRKQAALAADSVFTTKIAMRIQRTEMICIDCFDNGPPVMPDGPSFTITRSMLDTLPF